jgi:nucleoside-diphosphate-sugar epimerase
MNALIVGGTGLISRGIVKHLLARGIDVTMYNRGKTDNPLPGNVKEIRGDRSDEAAFETEFAGAGRKFDVVIDMICFTPQQAESSVRAFGGRCEQFIFCSTGCIYGVKVLPEVIIREDFPPEPISGYGKGKLECEKIFMRAHEAGKFKTTLIRPSHTYGEGWPMLDNLEFNSVAWDRIEKGLPVLCAGDGLGLWVSTHRDDCGKLFAYAAGNARTYGEDYNATQDEIITWRDYYREVARALGKQAQVLFMPAEWIIGHDKARFGLLAEITQFHGAYGSEKAKLDVPEFKCEITLEEGARRTLADARRRGAWGDGTKDALYQQMVDKALSAGVTAVEA